MNSGPSTSLDPDFYDPALNDTANNADPAWCYEATAYGLGDKGTPDADNGQCPDDCPRFAGLRGGRVRRSVVDDNHVWERLEQFADRLFDDFGFPVCRHDDIGPLHPRHPLPVRGPTPIRGPMPLRGRRCIPEPLHIRVGGGCDAHFISRGKTVRQPRALIVPARTRSAPRR